MLNFCLNVLSEYEVSSEYKVRSNQYLSDSLLNRKSIFMIHHISKMKRCIQSYEK
ncbi:hypothetical protein XSR1_60100 [Xenorhabdus szentirmaii DSM 16338]|uniref:Uncharacterized protein n=1 Tax=Xenorhabdus szentirmaii DSM 16338 TaxID=1427518 RepID=W1J6F7_9GAMM|nr:hypothetical protein XSR1_60100 [Xenorhabdus szentirmaii DSM 16338]